MCKNTRIDVVTTRNDGLRLVEPTPRREYWSNGIMVIPVVINMFRLPDFLTGENIMFNSLKLLQT